MINKYSQCLEIVLLLQPYLVAGTLQSSQGCFIPSACSSSALRWLTWRDKRGRGGRVTLITSCHMTQRVYCSVVPFGRSISWRRHWPTSQCSSWPSAQLLCYYSYCRSSATYAHTHSWRRHYNRSASIVKGHKWDWQIMCTHTVQQVCNTYIQYMPMFPYSTAGMQHTHTYCTCLCTCTVQQVCNTHIQYMPMYTYSTAGMQHTHIQYMPMYTYSTAGMQLVYSHSRVQREQFSAEWTKEAACTHHRSTLPLGLCSETLATRWWTSEDSERIPGRTPSAA